MRRRSANQKEGYSPTKRRSSLTGCAIEIKDAKDGVVVRCTSALCKDVNAVCFAQLSKKCCGSGITPRWYHISIGEHYCSACFDEVSKGSGPLANDYKRWLNAWNGNSKSQPSHRLFLAEEILPYWLQCNSCEKWRCLPKEVQIDAKLIADFSCHSKLFGDAEPNCNAPEDSRVKSMKDLKWLQSLTVPPLLKYSPAAKFFHEEYFSDGVGMSPTTKKSDLDFLKINPNTSEVMQPFYRPNENGKAMCIRPDVMEYDEVLEFPEYARAPVLYLGLRNLIVALWNINPTQWVTPSFSFEYLICRGMVRIICCKELLRILSFLTRKGIVNFGLLSHPPFALALNHDIKKLKVIVVGAGISGLAAARQLENFGAHVTVLEARSRIGGRICDEFRLGVVVGRGAQLLNGIVNNPIAVLCMQSGVKYKPLSEECPLIFAQSGQVVPIKTDKRVDFHFNAMLDAVEDWRKDHKKDKPLEQSLMMMNELFLKAANISLTSQEKQLLDFHLGNLEYSCGAPLGDVSSLHWDQNEHFSQFAGPHALMTDGLSTLIERLSDGLDIKTEHEVTKIDYSGNNVKVHCKGSTKSMICDKVLVTIPLALLKWQSIEFVPVLPPEKSLAIRGLGCGIIEKVALKFSTRFWHSVVNGANYFGHISDSESTKNHFTIFYDFSAKDPHTKDYNYVLMSYLSGKAASMVRYKSDEEIVELVMVVLRKLFPDEKIPDPENYLVTHWWEDQFSGMSYSYVKVDSSGQDYDTMADEVQKKVYFAGEATNRHFPQTVTGAYLSGLREASKIASK